MNKGDYDVLHGESALESVLHGVLYIVGASQTLSDGNKAEEQQAEIKGTVGFKSGDVGTPRQVTFASLSPLHFLKSGNSNISLAEVLWKFNELISLKVPRVVAGTKEPSERVCKVWERRMGKEQAAERVLSPILGFLLKASGSLWRVLSDRARLCIFGSSLWLQPGVGRDNWQASALMQMLTSARKCPSLGCSRCIQVDALEV